jgi:ribosomal protein L40E
MEIFLNSLAISVPLPTLPPIGPRPGAASRRIPQAGLGVISLVLAMISLLSTVLLIVVVMTATATFHQGNREDSPFNYLLGCWMVGVSLLSVCGIVFGIGGVRQVNRRHSMAVTGLCLNIAIPLIIMFSLLLALSVRGPKSENAIPDSVPAGVEPGAWHSPLAIIFQGLTVIMLVALVFYYMKKRRGSVRISMEKSADSIVCQACKKRLPHSATFCRRCGNALDKSGVGI